MKWKTILLVCFCISTTSFVMGQKYSGVAFLDKNNNGIRDSREKGISDILISDGLNFVKTNENGEYTIEGFKDFHFIMTHIPANYHTKKFYHRKNKKTSTYDFAFTPTTKVDTFKFVHISDTETYEYREWLNSLKEFTANENPSFVMHTGDICYKRGMVFHHKNLSEQTIGVPVKYSIGNHDLVDGDYGEQFYEKHFGPVYYSFEYGNVLFICTPMLYGDRKPKYDKKQVYNYLKNLLTHFPKKKPKIIFNHNILTEKDTLVYGLNDKEYLNLNEYNLKAWMFGHYHNNHIKLHGKTGIKSICTASPVMGGIDHSPSAFRIIYVDKQGNISTELRYTGINKKITIVTPKKDQICHLRDNLLPVTVNTYHSSSTIDSVRYSINPSSYYPSWHDLDETEGWQLMQRNSDFSWSANWKPSPNAEGKEFTIRAQAFLQNGQVIRTQKNFGFTEKKDSVRVGSDWTNLLQNAQHTGADHNVLGAPLKMIWTANAGSNIFMGAPVVADNKVFVATMDDSKYNKGAIVAYDAITGEELWQYRVAGSFKNTIVYSNGNVIATDTKGITYAVRGHNGALAWKTDLKYDRMPPFVSGICTQDGVIYSGFGHSLSALDAKTGRIIWQNKGWNGGEGSVPTMTLADDVLITSSHWVSLYGHDAKTGDVLWQNKALRFRDATTTFKDGELYVASRNKLFVINPKTGDAINSKETNYSFGVSSAPLVSKTRIIMATSNKGIVAFDRKTLKPIWHFDTKPALIYTSPYTKTNEKTVESSPLLSGNTIYIGASDGFFYAIDVTTGDKIWQIDFGVPIFSTATISGNILFMNDFAGNICAFTQK